MSTSTPWIMTASGRHFHFANPLPPQIDLEDIAIALSNLCRFTGHTRLFYSVAEHSVLVSYLVNKAIPGCAWAALLHDAAEAYCADVSSPLKQALRVTGPTSSYDTVLHRCEMAIARKFDIKTTLEISDEVRRCDMLALLLEGELIFGSEKMKRWGWYDPKYTAEARKRLEAHQSPQFARYYLRDFGREPKAALSLFLERYELLSIIQPKAAA